VKRKGSGPQRNLALGGKDRPFSKPVPIDAAPWFDTLRRKTGNFAFGLQHIKDRRVIAGLMQVAAGRKPPGSARRQGMGMGAGLGDAETNRLVERAAIKAIKRHYYM
jgi:hypothetical protein